MDECISVLSKYQPDIVIHTAGIADVGKCESSPDLAHEVNVDLSKNIALACSEQGVKLVHISTDHLFDGSSKNINEDDEPNPLKCPICDEELHELVLIGDISHKPPDMDIELPIDTDDFAIVRYEQASDEEWKEEYNPRLEIQKQILNSSSLSI